MISLREHAGAARLDGLDLSLAPGQTTEAGRKLGAVKEFTGRRADRSQGGSGLCADTSVEGCATEGTVLLGLGAVGSERVREGTGGRGRVNAGRVVHGLWRRVSWVAFGESRGSARSVHLRGTERFPTKRIKGVRAALRRAKVARIVMDVGGDVRGGWVGEFRSVCEIQRVR